MYTVKKYPDMIVDTSMKYKCIFLELKKWKNINLLPGKMSSVTKKNHLSYKILYVILLSVL